MAKALLFFRQHKTHVLHIYACDSIVAKLGCAQGFAAGDTVRLPVDVIPCQVTPLSVAYALATQCASVKCLAEGTVWQSCLFS